MKKNDKKTVEKLETGRKFVIYVKVVDHQGFYDESQFGWLSLKPIPNLVFSYRDAFQFTEKVHGHGSFEDWKKFFEEEYPRWRITSCKYI